jgi:hypothetical protein
MKWITRHGALTQILSICAAAGGTNNNSPGFGKSGLLLFVSGAGFFVGVVPLRLRASPLK